MNEAQADSSAPGPSGFKPAAEKRAGDWSRQKWLTLVALVFAAQVALIFALGEKQFPPPRAAATVPRLVLADSSNELIVLDDPTLFVLPHANDFATAVWSQTLPVEQPTFRWPATNAAAPIAAENLGAVFARFMQTNQFAAPVLDFKPEPPVSEPVLSLQPVFAGNSALQIEGELAQRKLLNPASLTNWPYADVIAPSRVQVLVNPGGEVVSAVLLPPEVPAEAANRYDAADQRALEIARTARFTPASRLTIGQMIFNWWTVPPPATRSPAAGP
jgi:hypothetical protein